MGSIHALPMILKKDFVQSETIFVSLLSRILIPGYQRRGMLQTLVSEPTHQAEVLSMIKVKTKLEIPVM